MPVDIEDLYERFGPMVLRRCRALLRDDGRAQDAMQDVFVALLQAEERLDDSAPSALLMRVATNVCLNKLRTLRRHPEDRDDELLQRIAGTEEGVEARSVARNLLAKVFQTGHPLAASTQTIAVLHLLDGLTLEEVAQEAGLSVSGVRKRLRTLRDRVTELQSLE